MLVRRWARSPFVFWLVTCVLGATTGLVVSHSLAVARAAARRYGATRPVAVAARPADPGHTLVAGDVDTVDMPSSLIPPGALGAGADARGRTVVIALFPGEVILDAHLAGPGAHGLAALLPAGRQAVAVPIDRGGVRVRKGDVVDVLATFDTPSPSGEPTFPVAIGATVVDTGPDNVTVAVTPEEAARVAYALAKGEVTLAVTSLTPVNASGPRG